MAYAATIYRTPDGNYGFVNESPTHVVDAGNGMSLDEAVKSVFKTTPSYVKAVKIQIILGGGAD